jgi:hypothetical protein
VDLELAAVFQPEDQFKKHEVIWMSLGLKLTSLNFSVMALSINTACR